MFLLTWTDFSNIKTTIIKPIAYLITKTAIDKAANFEFTITTVLKTSINTRSYTVIYYMIYNMYVCKHSNAFYFYAPHPLID